MDYQNTETKDDILLDKVLDDIDFDPTISSNQCQPTMSMSKILLHATRHQKFLQEKATMVRSAHQQQDFLSDLTMTPDLHREISANFCSKIRTTWTPYFHNLQNEAFEA